VGEVKNIDINIVGMFSGADEVSEIVDVAKVFIIEERMKDITLDTEVEKVVIEKNVKPSKKLNTEVEKVVIEKNVKPSKKLKLDSCSVNHGLALLTVRGLS